MEQRRRATTTTTTQIDLWLFVLINQRDQSHHILVLLKRQRSNNGLNISDYEHKRATPWIKFAINNHAKGVDKNTTTPRDALQSKKTMNAFESTERKEKIDIIDEYDVLLLDLLLLLSSLLLDLDTIFALKLYPSILAGQTHT